MQIKPLKKMIKKDSPITVYFTCEQKTMIQDAAEINGLKLGRFVSQAALRVAEAINISTVAKAGKGTHTGTPQAQGEKEGVQ